MSALKPQYDEFCRAYLRTGRGTRAAEAAGYGGPNAKQQAYRLLRRPEIVGRLQELRAEAAERDAERIEALLAKLEAAAERAAERDQTQAVIRAIALQASLITTLSALRASAAPLPPPVDDAERDPACVDEAAAETVSDPRAEREAARAAAVARYFEEAQR